LNKYHTSLFTKSVCFSIFLMSLTFSAIAEGLEGRWALGLRLGPSFLVQNLSDKTEGEVGPIIDGDISYGLTSRIRAGLLLEWEEHSMPNRSSDFYYGEEMSVSVIPAIAFYPFGGNPFSPYGLLGIGINLNSFKGSSALNALCGPCKIEPRNTLALKGGVGFDYFVTSNLAYNAELGIKMNDGTSDITGNVPGFTPGIDADNQACIFSLIIGVRYYY
jgi:opacity protein-like surface antigen